MSAEERLAGVEDQKGLLAGMETDMVEKLGPIAREFALRVLSAPVHQYEQRLEAIGFTKRQCILDAGCGVGQWTAAMSRTCRVVHGVDVDGNFLRIGDRLARARGVPNIHFQRASMENLPFAEGQFDAVFSYSAVYFTDYHRSLAEFYRVLGKRGRAYICTNAIGWFLFNILTARHATEDYSPREYGLKTILNTLLRRRHSLSLDNGAVSMSPKATVRLMEKIGFKVIAVGGEGTICLEGSPRAVPNYPAKYLGFDNVFEIIVEK